MTPTSDEVWRLRWAVEGWPAMLEWLAEIKQACDRPVVVRTRKTRATETRSEID